MESKNKRIICFRPALTLGVLCGFALLQLELHIGPSVVPVADASAVDAHFLPAATWSVDPRTPGENLPPVGRSLFDFLVTEKAGNSSIHDVPFPFQALLQKIKDQLQPTLVGVPQLKQVLIPLGRSLQRDAASPDFFSYPRVVVAVDTGPKLRRGHAGMLLRDRFYLGYQEKSNILEVISYNELAGRFEFQVVKDYRHGGKPRVFYANRAICTACHQNGGPIFSRQVWDETNANPKVASLLMQKRSNFYGIRIDRGVDIPQAIDDATDRANLLPAYQLLWREGCGTRHDPSAIRCRANAFSYMLQYRLSGDRQFDASSNQYQDEFLPAFVAKWQRQWPGGLRIPDPDIPNRNPLLTRLSTEAEQAPNEILKRIAARAHIRSEFEPLNPRLPLETWTASTPGVVAGLITGLSGSIAEPDVHRLDDYLFESGAQSGSRTWRYYSTCEFSQKTSKSQSYRLSLQCENPVNKDNVGFSMNGRVYVDGGMVTSGTIEHMAMADTAVVRDLEVVDGRLEFHGGRWQAQMRLSRDGLHARRADGNAIEHVSIRWRDPEHDAGVRHSSPRYRTLSGDAVVTVTNDFSLVHAALAEMVERTVTGGMDVFSAKPFRRAALMQALFTQLGMRPIEWCCVDVTGLPTAMLDIDDERNGSPLNAGDDQTTVSLQGFYRHCATCHLTREEFPPNFLYGDANQVSKNLVQCAERLYFRLSMWQLGAEERPRTPMPPVHALHAVNLSPEKWRDSPQLESLKRYVVNILELKGVNKTKPEAVITQSYETLRPCLP